MQVLVLLTYLLHCHVWIAVAVAVAAGAVAWGYSFPWARGLTSRSADIFNVGPRTAVARTLTTKL